MTDFETYMKVKFALEMAEKHGLKVEIIGDKARIINMGKRTAENNFYYAYQIHSYIAGFMDAKTTYQTVREGA